MPSLPEEDETRTDRLMKLFVHLVGHKTYAGYIIAHVDGVTHTITCLTCGMTSFNQNDIDQKYCGHCHVFHEDERVGRCDICGQDGRTVQAGNQRICQNCFYRLRDVPKP